MSNETDTFPKTPYRTPAEKPKEEIPMHVQIVKLIVTGVLALTGILCVTSIANTWQENSASAITRVQAEAAKSKAEADRVMWEHMK